MKLYKLFNGEELKIAEKIQQRRLQILVHSYLYYKLDKPVISDAQWDRWAKELVRLQANYPTIAEQVIYANEFIDWDGSTGAFFEFSLQVEQIAYRLTRSTISQQEKVNADIVKHNEPKSCNQVKKKNNILKHKLF